MAATYKNTSKLRCRWTRMQTSRLLQVHSMKKAGGGHARTACYSSAHASVPKSGMSDGEHVHGQVLLCSLCQALRVALTDGRESEYLLASLRQACDVHAPRNIELFNSKQDL